jgi:hypothetical protein
MIEMINAKNGTMLKVLKASGCSDTWKMKSSLTVDFTNSTSSKVITIRAFAD